MAVAFDPQNPTEYAVTILAEAAGVPVWPLNPEQERRLVRLAKANSHPDRWNGDRARWERVAWALDALKAFEPRIAVVSTQPPTRD